MRRTASATAALCALLAAGWAQEGRDPVISSLTLFAGTEGGLWRSRDWGGAWEKALPGAFPAIMPMGPQVMAGGTGGLHVSDDFGQSWRVVDVGVPVLAILLSRYPQADPTVFVGTPQGLLKSADLGRTFKPTPLEGTPVRRLEWPGPDLLAATGRGVLVSSDSAGRFLPPGTGLPEGEVRALALSSFYGVDPVAFAGVGRSGVYRSSDGARSWQASGLEGHAVNQLVWLGPFLYAATDRGLFRSEDAGAHWAPLGRGLEGREVTGLMFPLAPAAGGEVFAGTDDGVFRTSDGGQHWARSGLKGERVLELATFPPPQPATDGRRKR